MKTYSTSQVAELLGVAAKSVINWIDQGQLKAGRTPGGHRRITARELVEFLRRQQLPVPPELDDPAPPKVLIVDDDPAVTKWMTQAVQSRCPDWLVQVAHDGFSAGDLVGTFEPDVVLLDLRMPGMDGFDVCRRIKEQPRSKENVVIGMTGYSSPDAHRRIIECGARTCLIKPLKLETLIQELNAALE